MKCRPSRNPRVKLRLTMRHGVQVRQQVHPFALPLDSSAGEGFIAASRVDLVVRARDLKVGLMIGSSLVPVPTLPRVHEDDKAEQQNRNERERAERDPDTKNLK